MRARCQCGGGSLGIVSKDFVHGIFVAECADDMSWSEVLRGMGGWDGGVRTIVALGLAGTFEDGHGDVMLG